MLRPDGGLTSTTAIFSAAIASSTSSTRASSIDSERKLRQNLRYHDFVLMEHSMPESLLDAVIASDVGRVRKLLAAGADCNERNGDGATALMLAAHAGDIGMVRNLIDAGADANARDERGWGPLMKAAYNPDLDRGFADVVQVLIDAGADVEAPIGYGVRPLMLAAGYGETAVVETLLRAGADVLARNHGGLTALMMVKEKHYVDVINLLHEAEREAGVGEGSCSTKNAPGSRVVTFLRPDK
jgi:ankyrin repeat protein